MMKVEDSGEVEQGKGKCPALTPRPDDGSGPELKLTVV